MYKHDCVPGYTSGQAFCGLSAIWKGVTIHNPEPDHLQGWWTHSLGASGRGAALSLP